MAKQRFLSLDVMRGLTLALMILVNTPGSWSYAYGPLLHADWHGATFTDFIFPFFLFIVGSAMFFSWQRQAELSFASRSLKILRRTALIFLIGLALNAYPFTGDLDSLRILGVLQRIALAYCAAAFIIMLPGLYRGIIALVLLLGYWALLNISSDPYSLAGNVVRQFDLWVMGANHLWTGKGIAFDPEGILSTLPAIVNVLLGFEAARVLISSADKTRAQWLLFVSAVACIGA
ncbi:MAG TPA: heparan-alpha-glucosaminide N-acetyltransferase domain-containing protein, partial [Cellvibrionaceae bacterium]